MSDALWSLFVDHGGKAVTWSLAGLAFAGAWLIVRIGLASTWRSLLEELGAHAKDVVQEVFQVYVEAIKAGRADGHLEGWEKQRAKDMALERLKARFTWRKLLALGGGLLAKVLGSYSGKLETLLGGAVETAIAEAKREGKANGLTTSGKDAPPTPAKAPPPLPLPAP